jgi:RimJ/RimL family protein N-acetyltransferase
MSQLRFVAIGRSGKPTERRLRLDKHAREVCATTASLYERVGFKTPWVGYLAVSRDQPVGSCAFKAPPASGEVEIAYFTFPEFQGQGIATSMARELLAIAKATEPGITVIAQTLPVRNASTRILEKLGFMLRRTLVHPDDGEIWEWKMESQHGV